MRVVGWNALAEDLLGYSADEVLGKKCAQILQAFYPTGELLCSELCEGRSCITGGDRWGIESCRIRHKSGDMISAGISTVVLPPESRSGNNGHPVALIFLRQANGFANPSPSVQPLRIFTLGHFGLAVAGEGLNVEGWKRKQAVVVLKCLVSNLGRPVHRDRLIEWLWPESDPERGWERLKVTISFLRSKLRAGGAVDNTIETVGQSYMLRRDAAWVDSSVFDRFVADGWQLLGNGELKKAQARFEEAENLYHGDFLEDEPYADWCAGERERLREIFLELLAGMAKCYAAQNLFMEAAQVCRVALLNDPCRESFVRAQLEYLVNLGRPDWAESQFVSWRQTLETEYDLQPTRETMSVFEKHIAKRRPVAP